MRLATIETVPFGEHAGTQIENLSDSQVMDVAGAILGSEHAEMSNPAVWDAIEPYFSRIIDDRYEQECICLRCFMVGAKCCCNFQDTINVYVCPDCGKFGGCDCIAF